MTIFFMSIFATAATAGSRTISTPKAAVIAPLRHPLLLANQLATLDLLSRGRLVVQPTVSWHHHEYRALGVPLVFTLMGPLMVVGSYFAVTGAWSPVALILSIPVGLLVAAILHGNEWRDISEDTRAGIVTLSSRIGRDWAHYGYVGLVLGAYMTLGLSVAFGLLPPPTLLAILSLPFLAQVIRSAELGATGQARAIAMIDLQTARLHLAFGAFLVIGLLLAGVVRG